MAIGYLIIQVRTADSAIPLSGAEIRILDEDGNTVQELTTDESGETEVVSLETVDKSFSMDPNYTGTPFTAYDVLVRASGFDSLYISQIPVYEGETAIQPAPLIPMQEMQRSPMVTEITVGSPAVAMEEERVQERPDTNPRVLRQVVIPNPITVHLGSPSSSAANVQVPFTDYVKNVASSEIYPTWPEASLRANIYAIITFALNRIFTEWYGSQHSFVAECDELSGNKNVVRTIKPEKMMTDTEYEQIKMEREGMKVTFEFPRRPEQEESVRQEVKDILSSALQEYLEKNPEMA